MKTFYEELRKAEKSGDVRIAQLAEVCKADLQQVQQNQTFDEWSWWAG